MGFNGRGDPEYHCCATVTGPTQKRGAWAESKAQDYLLQQGLRLIKKNFNCRFGEIDLIMLEGDTLAFIEVRCRAVNALVGAVESVDAGKQQRLIRSAEYYLQRHPGHAWRICRFDVLGLTGSRSSQQIEWIKDAFQA